MSDVNRSIPELVAMRQAQLHIKTVRGLYSRIPSGRDLVSYETFRKLANGEQRGAKDEKTIQTLALALGISERQVERALKIPPSYGHFGLPDRAQRLDPRERGVVLDVIDTILRAKGKGAASDDRKSEAQKTPDAPPHVVDVTPPPVRRRPVIRFPKPYDPDNPEIQDGQEAIAASTPSEREQRKIDERERRQEQRGEENQDRGGGRE